MKRAGLLVIGVVFAFVASWSHASQGAQQLVQDTTVKIMAKIKDNQDKIKKDPEVTVKLVEDIVLPHFDFTAMSRKALNKNWKAMNAGQKKRFEKEFKKLLVRTYSKALADNYDQEIKYLPPKTKKNGTLVMVRTEVQQTSGFPIPLNYKLKKQKDGTWKVYDVVIDGISLISNYKTSFAKEVKSSGVDKLIARMAESNKQ